MAGNISLNFEPVETAIFDWINHSINKSAFNATTGQNDTIAENDINAIPIFRAETNYTRPNRGFVEYKFLTGLLQIGLADEIIFDVPQDKFKLIGRREFTITVTAFGEKSRECIAQIQQGLSSPITCQVLRNAGMSFRDKNTVSDATVFQEEDHEERSILDVSFGILLENFDIVEGLEIIENVQIKNKIVDSNAAGPYTVTIAKP